MQKLLLILSLVLGLGLSAYAYDFSYTYQGKTLFYTISYWHYVRVVNPTNEANYSYLSGDVTIPDSVENNGTMYVVTSIGDYAFRNCSGLTSVTIPDSVTSIGFAAFYGCSGLTSVTIPNSVTSIGNRAFYGCSGLTSVTIPNSVTSIGELAFYECSGLTSVTIPNSVTSISYFAFGYCSGLTSVTIPNSVTSIGYQAFFGCSGLTSVTIPNSVTSIGNYAFSRCSGLTSVTIPNSVTSIGEAAFKDCSGLTSVTIPNSVTSIGNWAFYNCSGLTSVTIPNSVTSIGNYAFVNTTSVYCMAETPPTLGNNAFSYSSNTHLYVPCNSVQTYQSASNWSNYASRIQGTPFLDYTYSFISNNDTMGSVDVGIVNCDSNILVTATSNTGFQFNGWSDGVSTNPRTIHLMGDTVVTALFDYITYAIVGEAVDTIYGTVSGSDTVYFGDTVTLTATANNGYHFSRWNDNSTENPRTIVATTDRTLMAFFEINTYQLTVLPNDSTLGTVTGSGLYTHGTQVTVTALPTQGNRFDRWSDNTLLTNYTFTLVSNLQLVAVFVPVDTVHFHDTTYIDVPYAVHDTTIVTQYDTTFIDNYIHDTTIVNNYIHDTTFIHDTSIVDHYIHDTTIVTNTVYDTTYITQYDTTYIDVYIHDTITITDTVTVQLEMFTLSVASSNPQQGLTAGNGEFPEGTLVEIAAIPIEGNRFVSWSDGNTDNPRQVSLSSDSLFIANFGTVGTDAVLPYNFHVYATHDVIVVENAEGNRVRIFDAVGRILSTQPSVVDTYRFQVPASGVYMIQVGDYPARKVTIVR